MFDGWPTEIVPLRRIIEPRAQVLDSIDWDQQLVGDKVAYLGGTVSVDARNLLISTLVKHHGPSRPTVLDVGCAGGSLAGSIEHQFYLGTDISKVAIDHARVHYGECPTVQFHVSSLQELDLSGRSWDVIVLSEVLYYLFVDDAVSQAARLVKALSRDGLLCISMKDDGKSQQIFRQLDFLNLREAILMQSKARIDFLDFRVRIDRESPAYLIAAFCAGENKQ